MTTQPATKTALLLSALVAPGAGQFVQRRPAAGVFYLSVFLISLVFLILEVVRPLAANILISIDFAEHKQAAPFVAFRLGRILGWLGLALLVYLAGLLDTARVYYCRRRHRVNAPNAVGSERPGDQESA